MEMQLLWVNRQIPIQLVSYKVQGIIFLFILASVKVCLR